jgi:hypothetical protein
VVRPRSPGNGHPSQVGRHDVDGLWPAHSRHSRSGASGANRHGGRRPGRHPGMAPPDPSELAFNETLGSWTLLERDLVLGAACCPSTSPALEPSPGSTRTRALCQALPAGAVGGPKDRTRRRRRAALALPSTASGPTSRRLCASGGGPAGNRRSSHGSVRVSWLEPERGPWPAGP